MLGILMKYLELNNNKIEEYLLPITGMCLLGLVVAACCAKKSVGQSGRVERAEARFDFCPAPQRAVTHFKFFQNLESPNAKRLEELVNQIEALQKLEMPDHIALDLAQLKMQCKTFEEKYNCPIGQFMMSDPVTISSGITFEKNEIARWLAQANSKRRCPVTRQILLEKKLPDTNRVIKNIIQEELIKYENMREKITSQIQTEQGLQCINRL